MKHMTLSTLRDTKSLVFYVWARLLWFPPQMKRVLHAPSCGIGKIYKTQMTWSHRGDRHQPTLIHFVCYIGISLFFVCLFFFRISQQWEDPANTYTFRCILWIERGLSVQIREAALRSKVCCSTEDVSIASCCA